MNGVNGVNDVNDVNNVNDTLLDRLRTTHTHRHTNQRRHDTHSEHCSKPMLVAKEWPWLCRTVMLRGDVWKKKKVHNSDSDGQ